MKVRVDMSQSTGFSPIPDGAYHVVVTEIEERCSRNNQRYLHVRFTISDGEYAGRHLWDNFMLEGKGAGFIRPFLEAIGIEITGNQLELDTNDLINKDLVVVTRIVDDGQKPQNEVVSFAAVPKSRRR